MGCSSNSETFLASKTPSGRPNRPAKRSSQAILETSIATILCRLSYLFSSNSASLGKNLIFPISLNYAKLISMVLCLLFMHEIFDVFFSEIYFIYIYDQINIVAVVIFIPIFRIQVIISQSYFIYGKNIYRLRI